MIKEINVLDITSDMNIIDIRELDEVKLKPAVGYDFPVIPMMELLYNPDTYLDKDKCYHLFCNSGNRTYQSCSYLQSLGFDVINLQGGYVRLILGEM